MPAMTTVSSSVPDISTRKKFVFALLIVLVASILAEVLLRCVYFQRKSDAPLAVVHYARGAHHRLQQIALSPTPIGIWLLVFALVGAFAAATYGTAIQSVDANVGALLGALLGGLIAGFAISELDIAAGLLGGVAAAAGVIAGRAVGSMLRTGSIVHTENAPGALAMFDGAVIAAPLFWMAIWFFG